MLSVCLASDGESNERIRKVFKVNSPLCKHPEKGDSG